MAGKRRHKWGAVAGAPPGRSECSACGMQRDVHQATRGTRAEYRDAGGRLVANFKERDPAPPCPGRPEEKKP